MSTDKDEAVSFDEADDDLLVIEDGADAAAAAAAAPAAGNESNAQEDEVVVFDDDPKEPTSEEKQVAPAEPEAQKEPAKQQEETKEETTERSKDETTAAPSATTAQEDKKEEDAPKPETEHPAEEDFDEDEQLLRMAKSAAQENIADAAGIAAYCASKRCTSSSPPLDEDSQSGAAPGAGPASDASRESSNIDAGEGSEAQQPEDARSEADKRSVFVNNVHFRATVEEVSKFFEENAGPVERVTLLRDKLTMQPRGIAYVEFTSRDSVEAALALNGAEFHDRQLEVKPKRTNDHRFAARGRGGHMKMRGAYGMGMPYMPMPMPYMPYPPYGYMPFAGRGRGSPRGGYRGK